MVKNFIMDFESFEVNFIEICRILENIEEEFYELNERMVSHRASESHFQRDLYDKLSDIRDDFISLSNGYLHDITDSDSDSENEDEKVAKKMKK